MIRGREAERIKLHLLASLARSQRALTVMLESLAGQCAESEATARRVLENMELISRYQRTLAVKITGIPLRRIKRSAPGKPWISREQGSLRIGGSGNGSRKSKKAPEEKCEIH